MTRHIKGLPYDSSFCLFKNASLHHRFKVIKSTLRALTLGYVKNNRSISEVLYGYQGFNAGHFLLGDAGRGLLLS